MPSLNPIAAAVEFLEDAEARDLLAQHRIRVNGVAVASVMSASLQSALKENPGWRDCLTGATPAGRIAAPSDVAETVQYLASDASAFVTGQVLCVDGGRGLLDPARVPAY